MPAPPCTGTFRRDGPSHPQRHTTARERFPNVCKPDVQTKRARRCLPQRTSTPSPAPWSDRKTDRESPCRAEHIFPATNRQLTLKGCSQLPAASSRKYSLETEPQSESDDGH